MLTRSKRAQAKAEAEARDNVASWYSLPVEIHLQILGYLLDDDQLPTYASVCGEWQSIVEVKTFRRLKLRTVSCIDRLAKIVRARTLVKHVWLHIELHRYDCTDCEDEEEEWIGERNNSTVSEAIRRLLKVLSRWETPLTLEISAQSPSDSEHWFQTQYYGADNEDLETEIDNQQQEATAKWWSDQEHGWAGGRGIVLAEASALSRVYNNIHLHKGGEWPKAHAVTGFTMRRQFRRRLTAQSLRLLLTKLPSLQCMTYETWQHPENVWRMMHDWPAVDVWQTLEDHGKLIILSWPPFGSRKATNKGNRA